MPLVEHLRELRRRLLVCLVALVPGVVLGWIYYDQISDFLSAPVCALPQRVASLNSTCGPLVINGLLAPFSLNVKVALATGIVASAPVWLYQLWGFITPGLYSRERRWGLGFLVTAVPLFFAGATLCYLILPKAVALLISFAPDNVPVLAGYTEYLSLVLRMIVVFGLAFELPVFIVLLNLAGLLPARTLASWWRAIVLAVFVFAAVATPTGDPITMLALAVPMLVLVAVAYLIAAAADRRRARESDEPDYGALHDDEVSPLETRPSSLDEVP